MGVKASFDTDNRIIEITEAPALGPGQIVAQQTIDIEIDFYSDAKEDWKNGVVLRGNIFPFITAESAGDALPAGQVEPAFFRLKNDDGWRILPYDSDHELTLLGNIVPNDPTLPIFAPRAGRTILIFRDGSQVAQMTTNTTIAAVNQTPKILDIHGQVERTVWFDETAASDGAGGYQQAPFNSLNSMVDYTEANGITRAKTLSDITLTRDFRNLTLEGIGLPTFNADGYDLKGMKFLNIRFDGLCSATNPFIIQDSEIAQGAGLFGYVELCVFTGDVILCGPVHIVNGISGKEGAGFIWLDTNGFLVQVTNWQRSLGISNMTAGVHTIQMHGGQLHLDAGCTGGTIYLRGDYSKPPNNLGTTLIIDQTSSKKRDELHTRTGLEKGNAWTDTPGQSGDASGDIVIDNTGDGETSSTGTRQ